VTARTDPTGNSAGAWRGRPRASRSRFAALRSNRDFRLLWLGLASSNLGASASGLAVPLLAVSLSGSELAAGVVGSAGFVALWLAQVPAGYLADMVDRRRVMLWCDALRLVALGLLVLAVATDRASLGVLLAVNVVIAVLWTVLGAAQAQVVRHLVPPDQIPEAVAISQARGHATSLAGPAVGGGLFALGRALPFVLEAVSAVVCFLCVWRIRTPLRPEARPNVRRLLPDVGKGWVVLWQQPFLRSMTVYSVLTNIVTAVLMYVLVIDGSSNAATLGASVTVVAASGLLGSLVAPFVQRRISLRSLLVGSAVVRAVLMLAAGLSGSAPLFVGALAATMVLGPVVGAALSTARMLLVPAEVFGRASSSIAFVSSAALPLAPLAAGWLLASTSDTTAQLLTAGGFVVLAVITALLPGLTLRPRDLDALAGSPADPAADRVGR
jgi:fucose permease